MLRSMNEGNVCRKIMVLGYFDTYFFLFWLYFSISSSLKGANIAVILFKRSHQYLLQRNGMTAIQNNSKIESSSKQKELNLIKTFMKL